MGIRFDAGGTVTIVAGTHSHGQGHATAFAQLVSEWLGVPFDRSAICRATPTRSPFGRGTYAARSAVLGGSALRLAADAIIEKAAPMAAHLLEASADDIDFEQGHYRVRGTDQHLDGRDRQVVLRAVPAATGPLGLRPAASSTAISRAIRTAAMCRGRGRSCDRRTTIDRYTVVDDCGRPINPMICEGQIQGGVAQGIGQALMENVVYDRDSGQLLTGSYMDYAMPRADDMGTLTTAFSDVPCTTNPLGIKGVGESGAIGAPPAVMNAVADALRRSASTISTCRRRRRGCGLRCRRAGRRADRRPFGAVQASALRPRIGPSMRLLRSGATVSCKRGALKESVLWERSTEWLGASD